MRNTTTRAYSFAGARNVTANLARADRHENAARAACVALEHIMHQRPRGWNSHAAEAEDHLRAALDAMHNAAARAAAEYERAWARALSIRAWSANRRGA